MTNYFMLSPLPASQLLRQVYRWPHDGILSVGEHADYDANANRIVLVNENGSRTWLFPETSFTFGSQYPGGVNGNVTLMLHQSGTMFGPIFTNPGNLAGQPRSIADFVGVSGTQMLDVVMSGYDNLMSSPADDVLDGGNGGRHGCQRAISP